MAMQATLRFSLAVGLLMDVASAAAAGLTRFPPARCRTDAVLAGTICLDRYEASVWRVPDPTTTNAGLVRRIHLGLATRSELSAGGATQLGVRGDDYQGCADNGQKCANDVYALSLPSELPSAHITWFQAQQACANAGKRLPTSAEWQVGAYGTPDPGPDDGTTDCNTQAGGTFPTGARSSCLSARGAFDMVGNLAEWVADWVPMSTECPGWGEFSDDLMCLAGADTTRNGPGALVRGGQFFGGAVSGPLTVLGTLEPSRSEDFIGFRCAR
jgi:formylglycine-generating enzyme required for sulfatase activity